MALLHIKPLRLTVSAYCVRTCIGSPPPAVNTDKRLLWPHIFKCFSIHFFLCVHQCTPLPPAVQGAAATNPLHLHTFHPIPSFCVQTLCTCIHTGAYPCFQHRAAAMQLLQLNLASHAPSNHNSRCVHAQEHVSASSSANSHRRKAAAAATAAKERARRRTDSVSEVASSNSSGSQRPKHSQPPPSVQQPPVQQWTRRGEGDSEASYTISESSMAASSQQGSSGGGSAGGVSRSRRPPQRQVSRSRHGKGGA